MRVVMKVNFPAGTGDEGGRNRTLSTKTQDILAILKPEAACFPEEGGERMGDIFSA